MGSQSMFAGDHVDGCLLYRVWWHPGHSATRASAVASMSSCVVMSGSHGWWWRENSAVGCWYGMEWKFWDMLYYISPPVSAMFYIICALACFHPSDWLPRMVNRSRGGSRMRACLQHVIMLRGHGPWTSSLEEVDVSPLWTWDGTWVSML